MFLRRYFAGDENAEMANAMMQTIDDGLADFDDLVLVIVRSSIQSSACCGGVMSSPQEQNTMIGDLMLRRSSRSPVELCSSPEASLLPTNSRSAMDRISPAFSNTGLPHHFSNSRKRSGSLSILE